MASGTSDLIVRLSLDTTQFEGSLSKFEGQMTKLQASCTNASTGITNFKQVTAQLQTSAQTLTDKLAAQKQKVADLEAAYEKSKAETGENSEETKKLAAQLEQAKQKVSQTEQALKLVTQQLNEEFRDKVNAIWQQICAAFEKVKAAFVSAFQTLQSWFEPIKASLQKLWGTIQGIVLKLMPVFEAIGAAIGAVVAVVVSAVSGIIAAIGPVIDAIVNYVDFLANLFSAIVSLFSGDWDGFTQGIKDAWGSLCTALQDVWTAIGNFFSQFWETLCGIAESFGMERAAEEFFASCLRNPSILFDEGVRDMLARIGVADWGDFYAVFLFPEEAADEILELAQTILPQYGAKVIHAAYGGVVMMTVGVSNERVALSALEALEKALVSLPYSHSAVHHDEKGEMYLAIQEARSAMMPASRDIFAFSYAQEKMLSRYILAGNAEAAQALLAAVYKENISEKKLSRAMRRYLTFDVLAAMVKVVADVPQKGRAEADQLFEKMEKKFYSDWNDDAHYELFAALAGDLAHLCARTYSLLETRALSLEEVFACVERHFTECDFNVSRAAELLDVSVAYLSKSFKELSGINLLAYISGVRITYAKELMSRERISVMEAARRAGFENPNTFIRAFKKYEGMTPGNYIKRQE